MTIHTFLWLNAQKVPLVCTVEYFLQMFYELTLLFHLFALHNELVQHLMCHMSNEPVED